MSSGILEGLICKGGFPVFNPPVEIVYIAMDSPAFPDVRQLARPDKLTYGGNRAAKINGCFLDGKKPFPYRLPCQELRIVQPLSLCDALFSQAFINPCAWTVPESDLTCISILKADFGFSSHTYLLLRRLNIQI